MNVAAALEPLPLPGPVVLLGRPGLPCAAVSPLPRFLLFPDGHPHGWVREHILQQLSEKDGWDK